MWTDDFFTFDDVTLHYVRTGSHDKPPLVLLHGFTDSTGEWAHFAHDLEADYDVIMMDERGHGDSSTPPPNFTLEEQAHDVAKLIKHLGIAPTSLIGHSIGAATAIQLALLHPDLLTAIVLEDPPLITETVSKPDFSGWKAGLEALKAMSPEERLQHAREQNARWREEELPAWVASKIKFRQETFDTPLMLHLPDWHFAAKLIHTPTLLITGENDLGAIITPDLAREAASLWVGELHIQRISGAGHNVRRDQPDAYFEIVTAFLRDHARG